MTALASLFRSAAIVLGWVGVLAVRGAVRVLRCCYEADELWRKVRLKKNY